MAKRKEKKKVCVPVKNSYGSECRFSGYDFEGTPDDVIKIMETLKSEHPGKALILKWQSERWDDYYSLFVYETREETDEEAAERAEQERVAREREEELERQHYERLAKKYGKD